ncbi:NAD-dependent epimerase/dehydratase family protein [Pseudooceanicola nanhaiensis]|uniref:NAD-dependent epimerase/dehydratase family protein n=1 Tax=Pseudooceanicola nanhaiensis TaxID=375761 RepID=UPI001CD4ABC4|nr:NAD-dependent epimerase/dehydratase family protein [Pseudooceanicola nanhaiensis]MCA0918753.1 NAD-dependent epimerase/dehydratase family protein [Pseudooceanicola nanhaiensis]
MTAHWLVTGGAGFIGGHLVRRLCAQGDRVTVVDDLSTGRRANLPQGRRAPALDLVVGDIAEPEVLDRAMTGVAGVFHCAATVNVQDCIADWLGAHRANSTGTLHVFDTAQRLGRLPVVYASSAAVYGNRSGERCHEEMPERPLSPYGADKLACEHQARAFWEIHGLPSAGLRLFNVYGPGQQDGSPYSGVLARFLRNRAEGSGHVVFGDGQQTRDFVHVSDVVQAMLAAMARLTERPQSFVSNVCTGHSASLIELSCLLDGLSPGAPAPITFHPERPGDIRHSSGDTRRMRSLLGLTHLVSLEEGLRAQLLAPATLRHVS